MRVGLLVCDHVAPEFRPAAGDYPDMFRRMFARHSHVEIRPYDLTAGEFPGSPRDCEAWITTGSRRSVYENDGWIEGMAELVREIARAEQPFVGVCFGHQMLAHALGGTVERSDAGWGVGNQVVEVPEPPWWLPRRSFRILNSHQDQVTELPPGGRVLGGNDHCPISLMQVGEKMVGLQGHPEFGPAYMRTTLQARRGSLIPEAIAARGLETLEVPPDTEALAEALVRFMGGADDQ